MLFSKQKNHTQTGKEKLLMLVLFLFGEKNMERKKMLTLLTYETNFCAAALFHRIIIHTKSFLLSSF